MILEGIVTTLDEDGGVNISPMGPLVDAAMKQFVLRPYQTSRTFQNLKRSRQGVLHVTDNVEMLAQAAVGRIDPAPKLVPAESVEGYVLADACRWYAFQVDSLHDAEERATVGCSVVDQGRVRDFFGFNRAKNAVLEGAILATRLEFLPPQEIADEFRRLAIIVEKTGGEQERRAFAFLREHVGSKITMGQGAMLV